MKKLSEKMRLCSEPLYLDQVGRWMGRDMSLPLGRA